MKLRLLSLAYLILPAFLSAQPAITIGPGESLGSSAGIEYFESLQDWVYEDCRVVDPVGDIAALDSADNARDLVALYHRDDPAGGNVYFRVDLHDLFIGVESGGLDIYVLIDTGTPSGSGATVFPNGHPGSPALNWELAVALYDTVNFDIFDDTQTSISNINTNATAFRGAQYYADLDGVELGIDRQLLLDHGWDGTAGDLNFQAFSAKDFDNSTVVDTIPNGAFINGSKTSDTAKFAFVLHGNQAISQADYIQGLIWNETVRTPNDRPTGYRRALESARIFGVPANIHVSATLVSSSLWAANPGQPDDGPAFVQEIADFLDGNPTNGEGSVIWGVYSEHIMPFFEGVTNQESIALNEDYLQTVFGVDAPDGNSVFWIPERVARGTTFADLVATGYGWTILDQINHLREWFGNDEAEGFKVHDVNGVNAFMINDEPDRFKFANTDGGLWIETRVLLSEKANDSVDQEQIVVVFDDWEAYAGRSFLSFNEGSDNPDNFETNLRWLANHPWIEVVNLEDVAAAGWTPVAHTFDADLAFETYDFLDFATEQSYENWYQGSALEEDFDDFFPFIRRDILDENTMEPLRGDQKFGALSTYISSNGNPSPSTGPAGTILQDYRDALDALTGPASFSRLSRLNMSTALFETAWHDEDNAIRCPDGTYCNPDDTFNNIAGFAAQLQFLNLRRGNIYNIVADWANEAGSDGAFVGNSQVADFDFDGEDEFYQLTRDVAVFFENDGGRLIAAFVRDKETGEPVQVIGNLLGFPDADDEIEISSNGGRRTSGLVDWFAVGPDTDQYVNNIYTFDDSTQTWTSGDGQIAKTFSFPNSRTMVVTYSINPSISNLFIRFGLAPDLEDILETGQANLEFSDSGQVIRLENTSKGVAVEIDYGRGANNASYNAAAGDGTSNSPRNQAMLHMVELSGSGDFQFTVRFENGEAIVNPSRIELY